MGHCVKQEGTGALSFGCSVSISGNTAIVGANGDDDNGSGAGSAYVFRDTGSGWTQVAKLTADDGAADDQFGVSVSISGNTTIVGANHDDDIGWKSGSTYVFDTTHLAMHLTDDTGPNDNDRITNATTPEVAFAFSEAVYSQDSSIAVLDPNANPITPDSISGWGTATLTLAFNIPLTVDGEYTVTLDGTITDTAGNAFDNGAGQNATFTLDTTAPTTTLDFAVGVGNPGADASLVVTVTATDTLSGVADGTEVHLDVDLNNDGDFLDPGETSYAVASAATHNC